MEKKKASGSMQVLLVIGMLALAWNSPSAKASPNVLAIQHNEVRFWWLDYALNQLGMPHNNIRISELASADLSNYQIILVGTCVGSMSDVKPYLDAKANDMEAWIAAGGSLGIFTQYVGGGGYDLNGNVGPVYGSGYYEWMPGNPSFTSQWSDSAHIVDPTHPITQGLTDADLSGWWTSPDGYFNYFPGQAIVIQAGYTDRTAIFTCELGNGKILGSSMDPDYHTWYNGRGQEGIDDAKTLLKNIIDWLTPTPTKPTVTANIDAEPDTLNLGSKGNWITAYIQLPEDRNPADINATTILLNGTITPVLDPKYSFVTNSSEYLVDYNSDGLLKRIVKFDRAAVESFIISQGNSYGNAALTVTGQLFDGTPFQGTDTILVFSGGPGSRRK